MADGSHVLRAEPLGEGAAEALVALLAEHSNGCFCRFWHFAGDDHAWQERCARTPNDNRRELLAAIRSPTSSRDQADGVVAWGAQQDGLDEELVGWLKLCPHSSLGKLGTRRPYRSMPALSDELADVWVVGCLLVRPSWRRRGVARLLLRKALTVAAQRGARRLLALPRRSETALRDDELWLGPAQLFDELGFVEVEAIGPYPLLERVLDRDGT